MNEGREFRPRLSGVVARDLTLARQLSGILRQTMTSVGARMEQSLSLDEGESEARALLERLSYSALEEVRLLGELTAALGRVRGRTQETDPHAVLASAASEMRHRIERYETLLGCTGDRVVRSVLTRLITAARRELCAIEESPAMHEA